MHNIELSTNELKNLQAGLDCAHKYMTDCKEIAQKDGDIKRAGHWRKKIKNNTILERLLINSQSH